MNGILIEYTTTSIPMVLGFDFNPESITYRRSISLPSRQRTQNTGTDGSQSNELGAVGDDITFSLNFLLDATDRMNDDSGTASVLGVQPEIDVLERMATLASSKPDGLKKLLQLAGMGGIADHRTLPVILFIWGPRVLPCQITNCSVNNKAFLPGLVPYRAEVDLSLKVCEDHDLYMVESVRQLAMIATYYVERGVQFIGSL